MTKTFAAAINCIDGRAQVPVIEYIKEKYQVDYVDMITEPGPNKLLSENKSATHESIRKRLKISIRYHNSKIIAIIGHHDCAANSTSKDNQLAQIREAIESVKSWGLGMQVIGLWISEKEEVSEVK